MSKIVPTLPTCGLVSPTDITDFVGNWQSEMLVEQGQVFDSVGLAHALFGLIFRLWPCAVRFLGQK
jgi:hypothetical protein